MAAWIEIRPKLISSGIDNVTADEYEKDLEDNIKNLVTRLKENRYVPKPLIKFQKYKDRNKFRDLNICSIEDRLVQKCFVNQLDRLAEQKFYELSYAYRKKRGHKNAIYIIRKIIRQKCYSYFVTGDILGFFDNIDHEILVEKFCNDINNEEQIINLIRLWIKCPFMDKNKKIHEKKKGIAQGMVVSPLLSNIYLNEFDHWWINDGLVYIRYADNFIILGKDQEKLEKRYNEAREFLREKLHLELNLKDYNSDHINKGFSFLGIRFTRNKLYIESRKIAKIKKKIKYHIESVENIDEAITKLNRSLYSWKYYYSLVDEFLQLKEIDEYIILNLLRRFSSNSKEAIQKIKDNKALNFLYMNYDKKLSSKIQNLKTILDEEKVPVEQIVRANRKYYKKQVNIKGEWLVLKQGTKISLANKRIRLENKYGTNEVPIGTITALQISCKNNTITTNLIESLANENIPIFVTNSFNLPIATFIPAFHTSLGKAKKQIEAFYNGKAVVLVKEFVKGKIENQLKLIRYYSKYWKKRSKEFEVLYEKFIYVTEKTINKINIERTNDIVSLQNKVLGLEGNISKEYWNIFKFLVYPKEFPGRIGKDAKDVVNIMLNYGYGVLYNRIHNSILKSGLNPQISYLHREQKNKPTLVFDIIEQFRAPVVERAVIAMVNLRKKVELNEDGRLTVRSRKILAKYFLNRLHSYFNYKLNETSLMEQITFRIKLLEKFLYSKSNYKSFVMKS